MKKICLLCVLGLLTIVSCKEKDSIRLNEEQSWRLAWRLIENLMNEKLIVAESQFDSLLSMSENIDSKFLMSGLEVKSKLDKTDEIEAILKLQNQEVLSDLCQQEFLKSLSPCIGLEEPQAKNTSLQLELIKMYINDQYVRSNLMEDVLAKYNLTKGEVIIDSFGISTDERNRNRLKVIIDEYGFPSIELVGKDAMQAVFLIIQHADGDKEWQKSQLVNIEKAARNGDVDAQSYAYLYDRIKVNEKEKQLYGTQVKSVDQIKRTVELAATEDMENLDARRREFGMMPIEMYKRIMLKNF